MANDFFTKSGSPSTGAALQSAPIRTEIANIEAGFDKMPALTGNPGKIVAVNSGATALEAITTTGTGSVVRATSPTLVTPTIGVATATSVNKVALTAPATAATLTIADNQTLTVNGSATITNGTHSGTNTGDQTAATVANTPAGSIAATTVQAALNELDAEKALLNNVAPDTHAAASKATPVDADELPLADSAASFSLKKLTWANLKTTLGSTFANLAGSASQTFSVAAGTGSQAVNKTQADAAYAALAGATFTGLVNLKNGANIASAATLNLSTATGNTVHITGTVGTSAVTMNAGQWMECIADGAWPLTYHATNNNINGNASYTCSAGDRIFYFYDGTTIYGNIVKQDGSSLAPPYSAIAGFTLSSIAGTSTTASCTVSTGQATALQGSATMQTTQITKASTTSWAVSNGNAINGYDGGTTLPNSSTIHLFMCSGASGIGSFASTSLTPTFPTGYAVSARRVGNFNTTAAGAPIPGVEIEQGGGAVLRWHTTQTADINTSAQGTSRILYALNVPTGIRVQPIVRATFTAGTNVYIILTSGDETDVAPGAAQFTTAPGIDVLAGNPAYQANDPAYLYLTTNTSGQIGARASAAATSFCLVTRGYIDFRRN